MVIDQPDYYIFLTRH